MDSVHGLTDFYETFQDTSDNISWQFETKEVSQSFLLFQLEPKYEKLLDSKRKLLNKKTYRIYSIEHRAQLLIDVLGRVDSSQQLVQVSAR